MLMGKGYFLLLFSLGFIILFLGFGAPSEHGLRPFGCWTCSVEANGHIVMQPSRGRAARRGWTNPSIDLYNDHVRPSARLDSIILLFQGEENIFFENRWRCRVFPSYANEPPQRKKKRKTHHYHSNSLFIFPPSPTCQCITAPFLFFRKYKLNKAFQISPSFFLYITNPRLNSKSCIVNLFYMTKWKRALITVMNCNSFKIFYNIVDI